MRRAVDRAETIALEEIVVVITLLLLQLALPADTLRLSLADALARAQRESYAVVAARADAHAANQGPRDASRAFLPSLTFEAQGLRTTDPVAAFGLKLRQENFQAADLTLDALNRPDAYGGFTFRATVQQPLIAPEGLFGHGAARRAARASDAMADRTAGATVFHAIQTYWGVQLAAGRVRALDDAIAAAQGFARQANALREQGLVTGLDARLARIRTADLEAQRLAGAADLDNARAGLRVLLALEDGVEIVLTDSLGSYALAGCADEECAGQRGDLLAMELASEAAGLGVKRAWATNLPALVAFADVAHHARTTPLSGGSGDWTIGLALVWKPFQGLAGVGAVERARAERAALAARREALERQARLEQNQARRSYVAALDRVNVAAAARDEAEEALGQAEVRYRTGVAPITELLDVRAALTAMTLNLLGARYEALVANAAVEFAYGAFDQ